MRRLLAAVVSVVLLLVACGGADSGAASDQAGPSPEEELLADYAQARNAGDIGRAVGYFMPNPVVRRHPFAINDYMNTTSELRASEDLVPAIQGSGTGLEFLEVEVTENPGVTDPDVTFSWRFFYGADGAEAGGEAGCIGGKNGKASVSAGKFTNFDWGFLDPTKCDL